jgi:glyoxylase-like metal-dependent hydrolase (beta-lactamase superfamily II)
MPNTTPFTIKVGTFTCHILPDVEREMDAGILFSNAPENERQQAIAPYQTENGTLPNMFGTVLIETGDETVLIDAGMGDAFPETGHLLEHLARLNIAPEAINTVIITHCHPDHIVGLLDADDNLRFPNANYIMWHSEWDFWTDAEILATQPEGRVAVVKRVLPKIADRVSLATEDGEVLNAGIYALPTPGHAPGHMSVRVSDGNDTLIFAGDALLHPLHIAHPDWVAAFDMDKTQVPATRRHLCQLCVDNNWSIVGYHFMPAGIGKVVENAGTFSYENI